MLIVISIFIFIFGLLIGSFLNCVIYRLEKNKSFLKGRSACPHCGHLLAFNDLIPVFSFVLLKGKCRYCRKKISWQYPLIELSTGIVFLISYFLFLNHFLFLIFYLFIFSLLIVVFVFDLKTMRIPSNLVYFAIVAVLVFNLFSGRFFNHLLAGLAVSLFIFIIWLVSRGRAMGFGDVELALLLGLFLGWPLVLAGFFSAFILGGLVGIFLIVLGKKHLKSAVPFAPFLIAGCFLALFIGNNLLNYFFPLWL